MCWNSVLTIVLCTLIPGVRAETDLLKNKSRPEAAADEAATWVVSEREMKERMRKEREARELKEKLEVCVFRISII